MTSRPRCAIRLKNPVDLNDRHAYESLACFLHGQATLLERFFGTANGLYIAAGHASPSGTPTP